MAACYQGGPGTISWQGQEIINFWLKRKLNNSNLTTLVDVEFHPKLNFLTHQQNETSGNNDWLQTKERTTSQFLKENFNNWFWRTLWPDPNGGHTIVLINLWASEYHQKFVNRAIIKNDLLKFTKLNARNCSWND